MTDNSDFFREPTSKEELIQIVTFLFEGEKYLHSTGSSVQTQINDSEIFLLDDFYQFLKSKHQHLERSDAKEILKRLQNDDQTLEYFNKHFFQTLREGFPYIKEDNDVTYSINLIDFKNFENNIFRVVGGPSFKQYKIDLVVYINGFPFVVWAFHKTNDEMNKGDLMSAWESIQLSQKAIPELFKYNAFCVICSSLKWTKYGISWGEFKDCKEWKKIAEGSDPQESNILCTTIRGLFCKFRLVEILDSFICFSDSDASKKIICRYPQYFGAVKLLSNIEDKCKKNNFIQEDGGKGGTYFGATGCGKSYTMLFLSRLLLASEKLNRPTILIITDRTALNYQLGKLFQDYKKYLQCEDIKRIEKNKENLRRTLSSAVSGGIYLTNIQKFRAMNEVLTNRWNFVFISDEAHRTQDSWGAHYEKEGEGLQYCKSLAQVLHESLPNATYVGFTATPRDKTLDVFGGVVDIYSMVQSVKDGFTVNIDLEHRVTRLKLNETLAKQITSVYDEMEKQGTSKEKIEEDKARRAKYRKTLSSPQVLEVVAQDIVEHYERRVRDQTTYGKAMVVVDSREAACTIYKIFKELRPKWFEKQNSLCPEQDMVNVVISNQDDLLQTDVKLLSHRRLADEFKKEKSSFKIAIVCGMWLTGFDVPSLDTMYLNRFISGPGLIQAISRVNRSYNNKKAGLVVCYVPIKKALEVAKNELSIMGGSGGIYDLGALVKELKEQIAELEKYFSSYSGWNLQAFFRGSNVDKLLFVKGAVEWLKEQKVKQPVLDMLKAMSNKYQRCKSYEPPFEEDLSFKDKMILFEAIRNYWMIPTQTERIKGKEIDELMRKAFSANVSRGEGIHERFDLRFNNNLMDHYAQNDLFEQEEEREQDWKKSKEEGDILEENKWLKDMGDKGISLYDRLKSMVERYNSSWDEQEKMKVKGEIQELVEKDIDAFSQEEEERIKEERFILFIRDNALNPIKEKYQLHYSVEDMANLSREIKQKADEYTQYRDWYRKTMIQSKLKVTWRSLLNKSNWVPEPDVQERGEPMYDKSKVINETIDKLLFIFKNFFKEKHKDEQE